MTLANTIRITDFFKRHQVLDKSNAAEFFVLVDEIVQDKVVALKAETLERVEFNNKDIQTLQTEVKHEIALVKLEIEKAAFKTESNMKSEFNKLLVWIFGIVLTSVTMALAIAKFLF